MSSCSSQHLFPQENKAPTHRTFQPIADVPLLRALSLFYSGEEGVRLLENASAISRAVLIRRIQFKVLWEKRVKGDPAGRDAPRRLPNRH
ncbi:hypothetical protein D0469_07805 [Peribacillus saganii]|uniref:Uncharacterized protein n=1 Tax=Peribacillus saganii TaxID=2303992 RepID=A0A372LQG6_9BACI|nr:hypothetical protein D0469_07805 [Peribacillus saganii]